MQTKKIDIPEQAQIVIVGGGIIGCSLAYHLTKFGCKDVVVLESQAFSAMKLAQIYSPMVAIYIAA